MTEEWRTVPGFPEHIVSSCGRVRHRRVGAPILKGYIDKDGYHRVRINHVEKRVHRLVCEAFHGAPPIGMVCAHSDGDPLNNTPENLRWASQAENVADSIGHGTFHYASPGFGEQHPRAKLTDAQADEVRRLSGDGMSQRAIARQMQISQSQVSRIVTGKRRLQGIAQTSSGEPHV